MTPEMRSWLRQQVEVMIRRKPNVTLQEMKVWIHGDNSYNWTDVEKQCLNNFLGKALKRKDFFWTKWPLVLAKVRKVKKTWDE